MTVIWNGAMKCSLPGMEDGRYHQVLRSVLEREAPRAEDLPTTEECRAIARRTPPDMESDWRTQAALGRRGRPVGVRTVNRTAPASPRVVVTACRGCGAALKPYMQAKGLTRCHRCRKASPGWVQRIA